MRRRIPLGLPVAALAVACGGGGGITPPPPPPPPAADCSSPAQVTLSPGQHQVYDPAASKGCFRLPASGAEEHEYIVTVTSGAGQVTQSGVSGGYFLKGGTQGSVGSPAASFEIGRQPRVPSWPEQFHLALRERERVLAADPANRPAALTTPAIALAPAPGSERTFQVCKNTSCNQFDTVTAVARYVGTKVAVYLDKVVPTFDTLTDADLADLGQTFDTWHYPINLASFGAESDIDANQVVAILLTDTVNNLTTDCSNGRILGFFWGGDLLTITGSNRGEVFYSMVPSPQTTGCPSASRKQVVDRLKPTLIHELQHMINFNQKVLVLGGSSGEFAWVNEGLSHFAEELGGRLIPAAECIAAGFVSCRSQYASGDITNVYDYLEDTEANWLVFPSSSTGTLAERGAVFSFMRWMVDHYGADSVGAAFTRSLVQTTQVGVANVEARTGATLAGLVAEWLLALYVDDLPGFVPGSPRLTFKVWNFRQIFADNCCGSGKAFDKPWPSDAPVIAGTFSRAGTLRGGSGRHFRAVLTGTSQGYDLVLAKNTALDGIDPSLVPRVAVVRIR